MIRERDWEFEQADWVPKNWEIDQKICETEQICLTCKHCSGFPLYNCFPTTLSTGRKVDPTYGCEKWEEKQD